MLIIVNKIWRLGGCFYITLFLGIATHLLFFQKYYRQVYKVLVIITVFFALYVSGKEIQGRIVKDSFLFFNSIDEKIEKETKNSRSFAREVKRIIPPSASGCLYRYWDTQAAYLVQELYPLVFRPIQEDNPLFNCKYIISQSKPRPDLAKQQIFEYKNNYLYKGIK